MATTVKKVKPVIRTDWTRTEGETPFFEPSSSDHAARYAVAIDTGVVKYSELMPRFGFVPTGSGELLLSGTEKILEFYNKDLALAHIFARPRGIHGGVAHIPSEASGTYIPLRPQETIKVLVTIPDVSGDFRFDDIPDKPLTMAIGAYDEVELSTYGLTKKAQNISKLLNKYDKGAKEFEGRVYNIDFAQQATQVINFASLLGELVRENKFVYSEDQSDLIMIGTDPSYVPLYAQINQGEDFQNLDLGFEQFKQSNLLDSNTMFIYKNFEEINEIASKTAVNSPSSDVGATVDWQQFLNEYIKFPPAIIEHTKGRPNSPEPDDTTEVLRKAKDDKEPIQDGDEIAQEDSYFFDTFNKKKAVAAQKQTKDWVGDNVLGNLDKSIDEIHRLEEMYGNWIDKIGMTYILRAAIKCISIDLPIDEIKKFLGDARSFVAGVVEILDRPMIFLDDLIPTVDIMWDITKQVFLAVLDAVTKALWDMLKKIVLTLLDACRDREFDPCAANFGGVNIGGLLSKGGIGDLAGSLAGPVAKVAGNAALGAIDDPFTSADSDLSANSKKFLSNLNNKISSEQIDALTKPIAGPAAGLLAPVKSAIGDFFDSLSSNLTCGETNDLLRGKPSPKVKKIIKELSKPYPELNPIVNTDAAIVNFGKALGDAADEDELARQIEAASEFFPNSTGCLTDQEDSEMRCALLKEKDAPDWACVQQNQASRERARKRANDLANYMEDPNKEFQKAIPPIYCTYDPETGKIVDGLVSNDHSSFTFMMDTTLNTAFGGVYNAFCYDVVRVPEVMKVQLPGTPKEISRVVRASPEQGGKPIPGASGYWAMNHEFEMAVQEGYKPEPYWKSPPWDDHRLGQGDSSADLGAASTDEMIGYEENGLIRTIRWNKNVDDNSNIPKFTKPTTVVEFCPGMSGDTGVYADFQTGYLSFTRQTKGSDVKNITARTRLEADKTNLQISIDNTFETRLQRHGPPDAIGKMKRILQEKGVDVGLLNNLFGPDRYAISLTSFEDAPVNKDKFSVRIVGDSSVPDKDIQIYRKMFLSDVPEAVQRVTSSRNLTWTPAVQNPPVKVSTKERHFVEFLQKILTEGENIYTGPVGNLEKVIPQPDYAKSFVADRRGGAIKEALLADQDQTEGIKSLYEELLRDLMASCLTQVKNSILLRTDIPGFFDLVDWAPKPQRGCKDQNLLDLDSIKDWIKDQYKNAKCIKRSLPNVTGLGDNRNNAFESAGLAGIVRATVRLYAVELVMKTLVTFSELQVKDIDEVLIVYIRELIMKEIREKGYLDDFLTQTLKAYNLEAATRDDLPSPETKSTVALDFFIKEEMVFAVEKLLWISGLEKTPGEMTGLEIDNLLINDDNNGWLPDFEAGQSIINIADDNTKGPASFHVEQQEDILGIKDWTNGSLVLEKYIRVEPTSWGGTPTEKTTWSPKADKMEGVHGIEDFYTDMWRPTFSSSPPPMEAPIAAPGGGGGGTATQDTVVFEDCDGPPQTETINIPAPPESPPPTPVRLPEDFARYFKTFRYGLRLVCKSGDNAQLTTAVGNAALLPRNALLLKGDKNKSYFINDGTSKTSTGRWCFPVACVEIDVPPDTLFRDVDSNFFSTDRTTGYDSRFSELVSMLKNTDEYKFMFDYCFPLKRLVSMCVLYNAAYVLPFPGLKDVFSATKAALRTAFLSMLKSGNYQFNDLTLTNKNNAINLANGDMDALGVDYAQMALQFIFGVGKGLGETFSPNISVAKQIQDAAKLIEKAIVDSVNSAKKLANQASALAGGDENWAGDDIDKCDLRPFRIPEIPIGLLSLGLLPTEFFLPGIPLGPFGFMYLAGFGEFIPGEYVMPGNMILGLQNDVKESQRCDYRENPILPTPGDSSAQCIPVEIKPEKIKLPPKPAKPWK